MIGRKGLCLQADAPLVAIFWNMFVVKLLYRFNTEHLLPTTNKLCWISLWLYVTSVGVSSWYLGTLETALQLIISFYVNVYKFNDFFIVHL